MYASVSKDGNRACKAEGPLLARTGYCRTVHRSEGVRVVELGLQVGSFPALLFSAPTPYPYYAHNLS